MIKKYLKKDYTAEVFDNITMFEAKSEDILEVCQALYFDHKLQLKTMMATDEGKHNFKIIYIFGVPQENKFLVPYIRTIDTKGFPSIAREIHEAFGYELKINSFFGVTPVGHPFIRPILLHENWPTDQYPLRKDFEWNHRPAHASNTYEFGQIQGEGIYEIPVGPVHAGIIEPGHFRFSVAGEEIVNLEAKLGYTHKGSEKLFEVLPLAQKVKLSERISGDSSFAHSLCFCQTVETLTEIKVSEKAQWLRVIFAELERLANHFSDIGFMLNDTGYSFGGSNGQRLREQILRWHEKLTDSRFLRGVNVIGGVTKDISSEMSEELKADLQSIWQDFSEVIEIAKGESTVDNRLVGTGRLDKTVARDHGALGITARAVGIDVDARRDYIYAAYEKLKFEVVQEETGDAKARFYVRVKEVKTSIDLLMTALDKIQDNDEVVLPKEIHLRKNSYAISVVEGWRGDIVYVVATDQDGNISRVEVRDPSFLNWTVVGHAGLGNVVPDFPLINKSFNLSYSGNDV